MKRLDWIECLLEALSPITISVHFMMRGTRVHRGVLSQVMDLILQDKKFIEKVIE